MQLFSVPAGIAVRFFIVGHVFLAADICPVFSRFGNFIIRRFDVRRLSVLLQEQVILLALISCICNYIPLQGRFLLSGPADKYDPFFTAELFKLYNELFYSPE